MKLSGARPVLLAMVALAIIAGNAPAQSRWGVDPQLSLAWWQVNPHLGHLWATTCPQEPSWRPGEGRSGGWAMGTGFPAEYEGNAEDTVNVPLYPRFEALPLCEEAVQGELSVADPANWGGVRGLVTVKVAALVTGQTTRDNYARDAVLQASRYPDIRFAIDSVAIISRKADTITGSAFGALTLRDVTRPSTAAVTAWPEAGGLRVMAKFRVPADSLVPVYGFSKFALGLGIGTRLWKHVFAGVDVILRPASTARD